MGFAVLMEGALAEAYTGEGVTITPTDNGGYEVTATYRIPR
jgi:hypothetical protein